MSFNIQHAKEVEKLSELEDVLSNLISKTNNQQLMDAFIQWQDQRRKCNEGYLKHIKSLVKKNETTKAHIALSVST